MNKVELKNKVVQQFSGYRYSIALQVSSFSQIPEYARFYRRIIEIYLEKGFALKESVFVLIGTNRFTQIISDAQLIEKIGEAMEKFVHKTSIKYNVNELFELLYVYLVKASASQRDEKSKVLVESTRIFSSIPVLYELRSKEITK